MAGYCISIKKLFELSEEEFIEALKQELGCEDEQGQEEAWRDCYRYLKKYFKNIVNTKKGDISLIFEYELVDRTRPDLLICCDEKILIIEFKSGLSTDKEILMGYRNQVESYLDKMLRYTKFVWDNEAGVVDVRKFLVFTKNEMKNKTFKEDYIKVGDEFLDIVNELVDPMEQEKVKLLLNSKNEASPDTLELFKSILTEKNIPELFMSTPKIKGCLKLISDIQEEPAKNRLNIVFVTGAPGTGKTAVAFCILKDVLNKNEKLNVKYTTGNGNLLEVFKAMINSKNRNEGNHYLTGEHIQAFREVCDTRKFIEYYVKKDNVNKEKQKPIIESDIIIFDEAQRAWSKEKVAIDQKSKKVFLKKISQPYMMLHTLVSGIVKSKKSKTIICLMGKGQEIYKGEEKGVIEWIEAINRIAENIKKHKEDIDIKMFLPKNEEYRYEINSDVEQRLDDALYLTENKRGYDADEYLKFVECVLNEDIETAKELRQRYESIYKVTITKDLEKAKRNLKARDENIKYGLLTNSYEGEWKFGSKSIEIDGSKYINVAKKDLGKWFASKMSNELNRYVTEFDCQGLEIDIPILIWGKKLTMRDGKWNFNTSNISGALREYYEKTCEVKGLGCTDKELYELEKVFVKNIYRVLLTRGRSEIIIYIEDIETYDFFKDLVGEENVLD